MKFICNFLNDEVKEEPACAMSTIAVDEASDSGYLHCREGVHDRVKNTKYCVTSIVSMISGISIKPDAGENVCLV